MHRSRPAPRRAIRHLVGVIALVALITAPWSQASGVPADRIGSRATGPSPRHSMGMTTDPSGGVMMFGGRNAAGLLDETWVWNGTWSQLSPPVSPAARTEMGLAFDRSLRKVVLWGGLGATSPNPVYLDDTWLFDGTTWTQVFPAHHPPAREDMVMTYDSVSQRVVMFGGFTKDSPRWKHDTWTFDGTDWTEVTTTPNPDGRADAGMANLPSASGVVLFGGWNRQAFPFNDTWLLSNGVWTELSPASAPSPRGDMVMEYYPTKAEIVLFGGQLKPTAYGDTWTFDGTNWTQLSPPTAPAPRVEAGLAYDLTNRQLVLFGGTASHSSLNDTWTFDGTTWTQAA
jgi:Galactose oxidase, central domain